MDVVALAAAFKSQCTFWCSVLSDLKADADVVVLADVSMHLLVLSAFRLVKRQERGKATSSQCTFWCSVLSDMKYMIMRS